MRIQDYFIESTQRAADEAFRYANAVPKEKLEWSPGGEARSTLDICRELAVCPTWTIDTIEGTESESKEEQGKVMQGLTTIEDCEAEYHKRVAKMIEVFRDMPDARLSETKHLPYEGGRDFTMLEMMEYPRWNCNYHCGQIAYIQLVLGDKEMH